MAHQLKQTYDYICFSELAHEFDFSNHLEIENKIKRRLKYYNPGSYDQGRIDYIRTFKNDLYVEISLQSKSIYFKKSNSDYADLADFDIEKMTLDFSKKYDKIAISEMTQIFNFAIYLYYMR